MKDMFYRMNVAGLERDLPLCPLNDKLMIGAFVIFGDMELTTACAKALVEARKGGPFISQDDMERRKVSRYVIEQLKLAGCLNGVPETSQVSLFELNL